MFGDALLLTAGVFVVFIALALVLQFIVAQLGLPGVLEDIVGSIGTIATPFAGAAGAWLLHGRRLGWVMAAGFVAGIAAAAVLAGAFTLMVFAITTPGDTGFPWWAIVIAAALGLGFVVFAGLVLLESIRDRRSPVPAHPRLNVARFVSAGLFTGLVLAVVVVLLRNPMSEGAEVGIFALMFAFVAGLMVLGADIVSGLVARRSGGAMAGGAA